MDEAYGRTYYRWEGGHWWCKSRRELLVQLTRSEPREGRVLDLGCSSGALLGDLKRVGFTDCTGVDKSAEAIEFAQRSGHSSTRVMDAGRLEFPDEHFDLLTASDILEHIEGDVDALREWARVLKPGGALVVGAPAFRFLWSHHDEYNHHFRRYRRNELLAALETAGLGVERATYWNSLLFLPAALTAALQSVMPKRIRDYDVDSFKLARPLNWSLLGLMRLENFALRAIDFPLGISLIVIARKPREIALVQRARLREAEPTVALESGRFSTSAGATRQ